MKNIPDIAPAARVSDRGQALDHLFTPRCVAVLGADELQGSLGRAALYNLVLARFDGVVHPVHPRGATILGLKAYRDVADLPQPADLAVIATASRETPAALAGCAAAGVRAAVILSPGFAETGSAGVAIEREIAKIIGGSGMRVLGGNSLGIINPSHGLNASYGPAMPADGGIAFLTQSGALGAAVLDQGLRAGIGFSAFVSLGTMIDVGWGDLIDWFGSDPHTSAIVLAMETLGDARAFLAAAREVASTKPIVVLKSGRSTVARRAASTHVGALAEREEAVDAAFDRAGILRVETMAQLFAMADMLAKQPRPRGPRLAIVGNAGGPGVLAADAAIAAGASVAELSSGTVSLLDHVLPEHWSHANPIDLTGEATPELYMDAVRAAAADAGSDGVLVLLTPQDMTDPQRIAQAVADEARDIAKPLIACWMGGARVQSGRELLSKAGIPVFAYPEEAANAFALAWRHSDSLRRLYETPALIDPVEAEQPDHRAAAAIIEAARVAGREALSEHETKALLAAWGIPVVATRLAVTVAEAVAAADAIGYPVALKVHSHHVLHKSVAGGVALWLRDARDVGDAFDRIQASVTRTHGAAAFAGAVVQPMVTDHAAHALIGSACDSLLGPMVTFAAGGSWPELSADRAWSLPPLTNILARALTERTRLGRGMGEVLGLGQRELDELDRILVRFSRLVVSHPELAEIEINPLLMARGTLVAADARAVLHPPGVAIPKPAIRPYPAQYAADWLCRDGVCARVRPIRPEDEPAMRVFHAGLGEHEVLLRYFQPISLAQRTTHERLARVCCADYDRELALVVETRDAAGDAAIVAVGRFARDAGASDARLAVVAQPAWRDRGALDRLVAALVHAARSEGLQSVTAAIMPFDMRLQDACRAHGFTIDTHTDSQFAIARIRFPENER